MKNLILILSLLLSGLSISTQVALADTPKPPHYGDWDVIYDKVLKQTTLIHQHRPHGEPVPGMGDAFTTNSMQLEYSFEAIIPAPGSTKKVVYYLLFDNPLKMKATLALAVQSRFFKWTADSQFTLLTDDDSVTIPTQNYHTGEFGDDFIGHFPYEELRVPLTPALVNKMIAAKVVAGNLSSEDQNANKSFQFDNTFKEIVKAFIVHVNEIQSGAPTN